MPFNTEFPDYPAQDMPPAPAGFTDSSWRQDACPSYRDEARDMRIWCDYRNPTAREMPGGARFALAYDVDDGAPLCESDDWSAIVAAAALVGREILVDRVPQEVQWTEFAAANPEESGAIARALLTHGEARIGGGAAPLTVIRLA